MWHQSNPVLSGVRWVIVIFYSILEVKQGKACSDAARLAEQGGVKSSRDIRSNLAKRMIDAAKRVEPGRMTTAVSKSRNGLHANRNLNLNLNPTPNPNQVSKSRNGLHANLNLNPNPNPNPNPNQVSKSLNGLHGDEGALTKEEAAAVAKAAAKVEAA